MYRQSRPRTGTYLDVHKYADIDARTDVPHRYGAILGFINIAGKLGRISDFAQKYGVKLFPKAPITQPPRSPVFLLLWGVLEYTLQTSRKTGEGIKYNTARSLQPADFGIKCSNSQVTCTGIGTILSLGLPVCHLPIVLLPPLITNV
jgi:hypothetical protein